MKENFKKTFAGHYTSENYIITKNHTTGTWTLTRKSDKKRRFFPTLTNAKEFANQTNQDERCWSF